MYNQWKCNIKINEKNYYSYHGLKMNVKNETILFQLRFLIFHIDLNIMRIFNFLSWELYIYIFNSLNGTQIHILL